MAVAIGSGLSYAPARWQMADFFGDETIKSFLLDGALVASPFTTLQAIFEDLNALTNAATLAASVAGHPVTGMNASPTNALQQRVSDLMVLTFTQVNPINAAKTVEKTFIIPAPVEAIVNTDKRPIVGTSGTGSAPARLARLIANLESSLIYIAADASINVGGWGYQQDMSGLA